jgi:hypothetical protein
MSHSPPASGDEAQTRSVASHKPMGAHAQDLQGERAALLQDFVSEALAPVENDAPAARFSLANGNDAGAPIGKG